MSCNSPLPVYQVYDYYGNFVQNIFRRYDPVLNPHPEHFNGKLFDYELKGYTIYETVFPCGQCMGCRIDQAREFTIRMCLETKMHPEDSCWDVTLTYDDEHVPMNYSAFEHNIDTGEVICTEGVQTLDYRDTKLYLMRLCKQLDDPFRYSYVGEYGDDTRRPHYHMILFGIPKDIVDPRIFKTSHSGYPIYVSKFLSEKWNSGFVSVQRVEYGSLAYVAGYIQKKMIGKDPNTGLTYYEANGLVPERRFSSNRPGIGMPWWKSLSDEEKERYIGVNEIHARKGKDIITIPVPRYFLRDYQKDHPHFLDSNFCLNFEKNQENFDSYVEFKCSQTDKSYLDQLKDREAILSDKNKKYRRNVV